MAVETQDRAGFVAGLESLAETPPLSVASIDVDGFAAINEAHGRHAGDGVLALVADVLFDSTVGHSEALARIGGDAFACAFPGVSPEWVLLHLDVARRRVGEKAHRIGDRKVKLTISGGIASWPQHVEDPKHLLDAADRALYRAKSEGRDRFAIYVEEKMVLKSNYYPRAQLAALSKLSDRLGRTEASLLREGLTDLIDRYRDEM